MLGCNGEERGERREEKGGSTYPKTTVMSITVALATALEEGSDPSCPDRKDQGFLFKDLPRAPDAAIQSQSTPVPPSHHRPGCPHTPEPHPTGDPRAPAVPLLLPACSWPCGPGGSCPSSSGCPPWAPPAPRARAASGRAGAALRPGHCPRRLAGTRPGGWEAWARRAPASPARVNQRRSMPGPVGTAAPMEQREPPTSVGTERGGIGKSDPRAIVVGGTRHQLGLGTGSCGDGGEGNEGTLIKMIDLKTRMHLEELRWAPSACVWENQQSSQPWQLDACSAWLEAALNSGHQIPFPMLGHLPCPSSLAPSSCGRSKNRLSTLAFQAGMDKKPQLQRAEAEKGKETTPRRASKPTQS